MCCTLRGFDWYIEAIAVHQRLVRRAKSIERLYSLLERSEFFQAYGHTYGVVVEFIPDKPYFEYKQIKIEEKQRDLLISVEARLFPQERKRRISIFSQVLRHAPQA
jgi:hypothetical protein